MDFKAPQESRSINVFPVTFRKIFLQGEGLVWVPRGISRNEQARCWRFYLMHENGVYSGYEYDTPDPIESLSNAFSELVKGLSQSTSRYSVDRRSRPPGFERDPIIDTQHTGVTIARSSGGGQKKIVVVCNQMVKRPGGKVAAQGAYIGSVSEDAFHEDPKGQEKKFFSLLKDAVAVRRAYRKERSQGIYREFTIRPDEVPKEIRRQSVSLPELDLQEIFDSYMLSIGNKEPRVTGGSLEGLIDRLRSAGLYTQKNEVFINGIGIKFYPVNVADRTAWIPKSLFYAGDRWRIKFPHEDGWYVNEAKDHDFDKDPVLSLEHAWEMLLEAYSTLKLVGRSGIGVAKEPLLSTGLEGLYIQPSCRRSKKSGKDRWSFSVCVTQSVDENKQKRQAIGRWFIEDLNNSDLSFALKKGSAMLAYHKALIDKGTPIEDAFVERDDVIPEEYWPSELDCPVYVEDIRYYVEKKVRSL